MAISGAVLAGLIIGGVSAAVGIATAIAVPIVQAQNAEKQRAADKELADKTNRNQRANAYHQLQLTERQSRSGITDVSHKLQRALQKSRGKSAYDEQAPFRAVQHTASKTERAPTGGTGFDRKNT